MAAEMRVALDAHPGVELSSLVLESSGRWAGPRTAPFLARLLLEIPRRVQRDRIEVVLFSSMVTAAVAVAVGHRVRARGAILAATPVGRDVTLPNPLHQRLVPRIFAALDLVLPISRATGAECLARGLPPARMAVVPVGIDLSRFPPVLDRKEARRDLLEALARDGQPPLPEDALLLASVGRHQERKGFHWFVSEVMPRLPADAVFLLGGEGPMTEAIRQEVQRGGLAHRVRMLGRLSEAMLSTLYRGADLFVMPNIPVPGDMEGFGVVMLEAGLSGLPIVAADLEGIRDVVADGENGRLVPTGDAGGFAHAILDYAGDPAGLAAASARAARYTASRFAWPAVVEQYLSALNRAHDIARGDGGRQESAG